MYVHRPTNSTREYILRITLSKLKLLTFPLLIQRTLSILYTMCPLYFHLFPCEALEHVAGVADSVSLSQYVRECDAVGASGTAEYGGVSVVKQLHPTVSHIRYSTLTCRLTTPYHNPWLGGSQQYIHIGSTQTFATHTYSMYVHMFIGMECTQR